MSDSPPIGPSASPAPAEPAATSTREAVGPWKAVGGLLGSEPHINEGGDAPTLTALPPVQAPALPEVIAQEPVPAAPIPAATAPEALVVVPAAAAAPPAAATVAPAAEASPSRLSLFLESTALLSLTGLGLGLGLWTALHRELVAAYALSNQLAPPDRAWVLRTMFAGAFAMLALGWASAWPRKGARLEHLRRVASRLSPWGPLALSPLLLNWSLWPGKEQVGLTLILGAGLLLERAFAAAVATGPVVLPTRLAQFLGRRATAIARTPWLPFLVVLLGAAFYAVFFSIFMINTHFRTGTSAYDLGIENNLVWNAAHWNAPLFKTSPLGGPNATHVGYHETFISYLLAIPYRLWPTPEALLCLQATLIAFATVPLHLWARAKIGAWPSALVCLAYLVSPAVHGANLYDFHYQPLAPFFIFWVLLFMEQGRWKPAIVWVLLTLALREDMSLMLAVVGGYLIFTRAQVRAGLILAGVCLVVFVVQKNIIMPSFLNGFPAYINQYQGLLPQGETGFGGVIKTVIANPSFTVNSLLEGQKLTFGLHIFAPLILLPLRRWVALWLCLPGFFFTLLSTQYPPLLMISFQYTAYWSMFVFLAVTYVVWRESDAARKKGMIAGMAFASLAASVCFGAIFQQNTAHGAWDGARLTLNDEDRRRHRDLYEAIGHIPADAKVAASERLNPHVSSRPDAYTLRGTIFDAEYVLFETPFLGGIERDAVRPHLESKEFGVAFEKGNFWLLKRGADTARNDDVLRYLR